MLVQHLPDGACGKPQLVETQQLALETFGTQMAPPAHLQEKGFVFWLDFALAQLVGAATLRVQPRFSLELVATPPLEQCNFGDATTSTGQGCILALLVMLHPAQPRYKAVPRSMVVD